MNNTDIKPALTAEEWEHAREWVGPMEWDYAKREIGEFSTHGIAALALHGEPYGFTWEDVEFLERQALSADASDTRGGDAETFRDLLRRIAALLPPRE